jgi:hypothetical protein
MEIGSLAQWVSAAISTLLAVLAIWGDQIRSRLVGPKLDLILPSEVGDLVTDPSTQKRKLYFHLKVENRRTWSPAEEVRVLLTHIEKQGPGRSFFAEPMITPLQLRWAYSFSREQFPTIMSSDTCDLGCLDEIEHRFRLTTYIKPEGYPGFVGAEETMRVKLNVYANRLWARKSITIEISWDGKWSAAHDMFKHLSIVKADT